MISVSPWFFTNLPSYDKNWLWKGDDLWFDRWQDILYIQPGWIEIVSWNDCGESHYIGPLRENAIEAFTIGEAPCNYAANMHYDAWRSTLPFSIDLYDNNVSTISQELLTVWYRPNLADACGTGGTAGSTASQLQIEFQPFQIVEDKVFFTAPCDSPPSLVIVGIGGSYQAGTWSSSPDSGIGLYHGSAPFDGNTGAVDVVFVTAAHPQCQAYVGSATYNDLEDRCLTEPTSNSHIVGTTTKCGCPRKNAYCQWPVFVITTSSQCGSSDEVGGGCSGNGQLLNSCSKTYKAATHVTAVLADNGFRRRDLSNETAKALDLYSSGRREI